MPSYAPIPATRPSIDTSSTSRSPVDWLDALRSGDVIGRYIIRRQLGEGGMGVVFEVYDPTLDRCIALKVLRQRRGGREPPTSNYDESAARDRLLMREANGMAQLSHPHVLPVFDVGWIDGRFFLAMELNRGSTLM